ncbi:MAG: histidine--tRNA ligase [Hydrogenophilales bacterium 16-64-46]|nr:MAG: histidine--tRNA ligase [Hydrogenophilales bacterium 12-64-13]OYZ06174.1 MAG: histidine--tRNA ligase [Hydrogenophilales bacterium 16-64-46]OZA38927.1 MAG: histidine--tRNA ligase [Hydrogenophilales bacterium 17-64-34]HQT01060.1 histidine--tRNA ligase [Thiobacillus sp.]
MSHPIQSVRGMNDGLPDTVETWQAFESIVRDWLRRYGYRELRTPILEHTGLFKRAIGEVTDIVEKEMYTFVDELNGETLTLRPEGTASAVRAAIQHNLLYDGGKRLWYTGPMFRHERPQKGRYRQFHQVGVEALGFGGPDVDAELIVMCADLWRALGIAPTLQLNTLGDAEARQRHRAKLIAHYEQHLDLLDEDGRRRLHSNPLRILDSKNPAMASINDAAPRLMDELGDESRVHFEGVQALLTANGVSFEINPRLVRGLDYYNRTVFEWVTDQLGAQGTVCAGGRYDGLVEQLGGKPAPAAGFAMGIERLLALMETAGAVPEAAGPDVYIVHAGEQAAAHAWRVAAAMRAAGLAVVMHAGGGSFKSQMKKADTSRARYAVIIGDDEAVSGDVTLKSLRVGTEQVRVDPARAIELLK